MKQSYQIGYRTNSKALAELLAKEGQLRPPMLELIEQSEVAIAEQTKQALRLKPRRMGKE